MLEAEPTKLHVADVLGVSESTVARKWEQFPTHRNVRYRHGDSRERITTQRED